MKPCHNYIFDFKGTCKIKIDPNLSRSFYGLKLHQNLYKTYIFVNIQLKLIEYLQQPQMIETYDKKRLSFPFKTSISR